MRCPTLSELPTPSLGKTGWPWTEETRQLPDTMPEGLLWPRVSIVTPSYNQAQFLEETIRSVLLQGYPSIEYFVIDGGSTDGSLEIIHKYAPWLAGWVSEKDKGQSDAINKGLKQASGEILAWLNSDDLYLPGCISAVVNAFAENPAVGLIYGDLQIIDDSGRVTGQHSMYPYTFTNQLTHKMIIPQPSAFWRKEVMDKVGFLRTDLHFAMDYEFWLRIGLHFPIVYLNHTLAQFRISSVSKSGSKTAGWPREFLRILDDLYDEIELPEKILSLKSRVYAAAYYQGAIAYLTGYHLQDARRWLWCAVRLDSRYAVSIGWWMAIAKTYMGRQIYRGGRALKSWLRKWTSRMFRVTFNVSH